MEGLQLHRRPAICRHTNENLRVFGSSFKTVEIFRECPWFPRLYTANLLPEPDEPPQPGWKAARKKIELK
jgi:hypothetical protein